jgi:hypothetical protein
MLQNADALLVPQQTNGTMIRIKHGVWADAFASMKPTKANSEDHHPDHHQNVGNIGASAIFKILRERPLMVRFEKQQGRKRLRE